MFEITKNNQNELQSFIDCGKAYKNAVYDFTFEKRFIIYHAELAHELHYICLDMNTGSASEILRRKIGNEIPEGQFRAMTPHILNSIKYTGDMRKSDPMKADPIETIDSIFRVVLPSYGYAVREEQIKLSKRIYKGLTEKLVSLCEAEVGTGKTMAYLVAAIVARHNNQLLYDSQCPVTITTSSIELQKALVKKEIPALSQMLKDFCIIDKPLSAILRKGKEHYFCKNRYNDFLESIKPYPEKYGKLMAFMEGSEFEKKAFDLDNIGISPSLKDKVCVKGSCAGCKYADECKYRQYLSYAGANKDIDFQITNHNMYLASVKASDEDGGRVLRSSDFVIIDEAHKLKECAESTFGTELCKAEIIRYLNTVKILCKEPSMLPSYKLALGEIDRMTKALFTHVSEYLCEDDCDIYQGSMITLSDEDMQFIRSISEQIAYIEKLRTKPQNTKLLGKNLLSSLKAFMKPGEINVWVEVNENNKVALCSIPKDIGKILYKTLWDKDVSHVLTSGTMSDGKDFNYFCHENGIERINRRLLDFSMTPSPFDYGRNTRLYIPEDMPLPDNDDPKYISALADRIVQLVKATNGHTAILFTSYKVLYAVYEQTKDRLSQYDVICMTRSNKTAITDFKKSKNGVLFASGSMWEGVDCVGDCLSSLIIPRLPFPLRSATMEQKKDESGSVPAFVSKYAVPEMIIKLRQGIGRLIRSEKDTGVISILDVRATTRYKNAVGIVTDKYPVVESIEEIEAFLKAVKPEGYYDA